MTFSAATPILSCQWQLPCTEAIWAGRLERWQEDQIPQKNSAPANCKRAFHQVGDFSGPSSSESLDAWMNAPGCAPTDLTAPLRTAKPPP